MDNDLKSNDGWQFLFDWNMFIRKCPGLVLVFHLQYNLRSCYRVRDSYFTTGRPQRCGGMLRHGLHDLPAKERARVFLERIVGIFAQNFTSPNKLTMVCFLDWFWSCPTCCVPGGIDRRPDLAGRGEEGGLQQASNCGSLVEQRSDPNTVNTKWSQVTYQSADCCAIFSRLSVISWNNFYGCHHDMWSHCKGDTMKATSSLVSLSIHFFLIQRNVFDQCYH